MLGEAAQGFTRQQFGGWLPVCPHFCTGELKIFRMMCNLAQEKGKIAVICISGQNKIWAYGSQIQPLHLSRGDVESEGKGQRGCRKSLTAGE